MVDILSNLPVGKKELPDCFPRLYAANCIQSHEKAGLTPHHSLCV